MSHSKCAAALDEAGEQTNAQAEEQVQQLKVQLTRHAEMKQGLKELLIVEEWELKKRPAVRGCCMGVALLRYGYVAGNGQIECVCGGGAGHCEGRAGRPDSVRALIPPAPAFSPFLLPQPTSAPLQQAGSTVSDASTSALALPFAAVTPEEAQQPEFLSPLSTLLEAPMAGGAAADDAAGYGAASPAGGMPMRVAGRQPSILAEPSDIVLSGDSNLSMVLRELRVSAWLSLWLSF